MPPRAIKPRGDHEQTEQTDEDEEASGLSDGERINTKGKRKGGKAGKRTNGTNGKGGNATKPKNGDGPKKSDPSKRQRKPTPEITAKVPSSERSSGITWASDRDAIAR